MEKGYDLNKAKRRLHDDGLKINGKTPFHATYDDVIRLYIKTYKEGPTKDFPRKSKIKNSADLEIFVFDEKKSRFENYKVYIKSGQWKAFRRFIIQKDNNTCQHCFRKFASGFLHVHHIHYRSLGKEKPEDVLLLCQDCHHEEHVRISRKIKSTTKP